MSKKQDRFIIVKYAEDNWPHGVAPKGASIWGSYSAKQCGITQETYPSRGVAELDLTRLRLFNPTVHYGIVRVEDEQEPE